jgi:hypothetical protein
MCFATCVTPHASCSDQLFLKSLSFHLQRDRHLRWQVLSAASCTPTVLDGLPGSSETLAAHHIK